MRKQQLRKPLTFCLFFLMILSLSACNSQDHTSVLQKCSTLSDESITYARANYVKLFYHFNPKKFEKTFQQVKDFDHITHRNVINTYNIAVRKLKTKDAISKAFVSSCNELAKFSVNLVDQAIPRAIAHKSEFNQLTDNFFIEINQIVKFDHKIGVFDKKERSFKHIVKAFEEARKNYIETFKTELSDNN